MHPESQLLLQLDEVSLYENQLSGSLPSSWAEMQVSLAVNSFLKVGL